MDQSAIEAIEAVGPGGHFFGSPHTMERYETAFYQPMLSDWRNFESWQEAGSVDATHRAHRIYRKLLEGYEKPPLDASVTASGRSVSDPEVEAELVSGQGASQR